jgi:hypothetical protein
LATKFYFHNVVSTVPGTLPTTSQSALGAPAKTADAVTVSRSMDTTIGVAQTSKVVTTNASASAQIIYFTRFVSEPLNTTSVSANTWTLGFAVQESNANANYPVTTSGALRITAYVWRPSDGSLVGDILDGTGPTVAEATTSETTKFGTFSGSAVTCQVGDVICMEFTYSVTQGTAAARTDTLYYDGTTEPASDNAAASNAASFLSTPQTLSFAKVRALATETVTSSGTAANLEAKQRALATETVTKSETVARLNGKWRRIAASDRWF